MDKGTKIIAWTLGAAGVVAVVLLAATALLPRLIGSESVKSRILDAASRMAGGPVTFGRSELILFPRPGVVVRGPAFAIPGKVAGAMESLAVYPEILPLLAGTFRVARIEAKAPSFNVPLPARMRRAGESPLSLAQIEGKIASLLADAAWRAPGLVVAVREGRLELSEGGRTVFSFRDADGRVEFRREGVAVRVACRSDFFDRLSAAGSLDPKPFKGGGRIEVARFRPRALAGYLFPKRALFDADSVADLAIVFRADGIGVLQANVEGTTSSKLALTGRLLLDRITPRVELEAGIRDADIASLRDTALALAGDEPAVREICGIARSGRIPSASFRSRGAVPEELGHVENIVASARLVDGSVLVPGIALEIGSARGDLSLAKGILEGRGLSGRVGKSELRDGRLTLGLAGRNPPFRLETWARADLSELPPLLSRLIGTESARDAISRIEDSRGTAEGRLTLGGTAASITIRVDVSEMRLFARHRAIPVPVAISRGRLTYDGNTVAIAELAGTAGQSSFAGLAARLTLGKDPAIDVSSGSFGLSLGEVFPWLASLDGPGGRLAHLTSLEGSLDLSVAHLSGPLSDPGAWRFEIAGEAKDLAAATPWVPGLVRVARGRFGADAESISFTDLETRLLDASVRISGAIHGYRDGIRKAGLAVDGSVGPEANRWLSDLVRLPRDLRVRSPVAVSGGRLTVEDGAGASVSGRFAFGKGPTVSLNLRKTPDALAVDNLAVRDAESNATIRLRLGTKALAVAFSGTLTDNTVNAIMLNGPVRRGRLKGDIRADVPLDRPSSLSAVGTLEGRDLVVPLRLGGPLAIDTIFLEARGRSITVKPSDLAWMDQRLTVEGDIRAAAEGVHLDMDIRADRIAGDRIRESLSAGAAEAETATGAPRPWRLPVTGTVRLEANAFTYGTYTWTPFRAGIALSPESVGVELVDGALCGISTPGVLTVTPQDLSVDFRLSAADREIAPALACLGGKKYGATGRFTFRGRVSGRGAPDAIVRSLKGDFAFEAAKGRINRLNLLSKILAVVNVTEMFRGKFPDLGANGFAYNAIRAGGIIEGGKIILKEDASLDGASMGILAHGDVDIRDRTVDMVALVAPLRTVDAVIRRIPVLRYILGGSLVSIPVGLRGDFDDPKISVLPASEIGTGMLGLLERILKAPVKIIEPVVGGLEKSRSKDHQGYPYQP